MSVSKWFSQMIFVTLKCLISQDLIIRLRFTSTSSSSMFPVKDANRQLTRGQIELQYNTIISCQLCSKTVGIKHLKSNTTTTASPLMTSSWKNVTSTTASTEKTLPTISPTNDWPLNPHTTLATVTTRRLPTMSTTTTTTTTTTKVRSTARPPGTSFQIEHLIFITEHRGLNDSYHNHSGKVRLC